MLQLTPFSLPSRDTCIHSGDLVYVKLGQRKEALTALLFRFEVFIEMAKYYGGLDKI